MKVCVVGGTGNISASFVRLLLEAGHEVACFNRGESGPVPEGVRLIQGDRHNRAEFEGRMQAERFDAAYDMICFNREDAESSLRAFRGVGHFIHCSTVCTYGIDPDWAPVTEDHAWRPISGYGRGKVDADRVYLAAHYAEDFPVTILKPSTTYGPIMGIVRQIAWDLSFIDRIRKGKPILICAEGAALHQYLHVDDAAKAFAGVLGKDRTKGQIYNVVNAGCTTWKEYHEAVMEAVGRSVPQISIPLSLVKDDLIPESGICREIFAHSGYYDSAKVFRDVPEFIPKVGLVDGLRSCIEQFDREGRIPDSASTEWEDRVIESIRAS